MGKLAPLANDAPPSVIFENLALSNSTHYAARRSSIGESGTVQVINGVFLITLTLFCKVSSVICEPAFFSGLCFNNFLFVYAYSNCSNSLREGRAEFSVLLYDVTNFSKSRDQPGHLVPLLRTVSPLKTGNRMVTHWYFDSPSWPMFIYQILNSTVTDVNEGLQDCHLPTKIHVICPPYVLKNLLKWHALTPTLRQHTLRFLREKRQTHLSRNCLLHQHYHTRGRQG